MIPRLATPFDWFVSATQKRNLGGDRQEHELGNRIPHYNVTRRLKREGKKKEKIEVMF
jgi:hypothetical protein